MLEEVGVQGGFEDDECFLHWNEDVVPGIQMAHMKKGRSGKNLKWRRMVFLAKGKWNDEA